MSRTSGATPDSRTALRVCPLCEATCGLTLTIEGTRVTGARGDRDDVFSKGFICPKGASFGAADGDPDRLRTPLVRTDGELREATWQEAFDAIAAGLGPIVEQYGPHALGIVLGNPNVHTMAGALYPPVLLSALRTHSVFTASTLDQMPKHVSSGLLYGDANAIPVPDLDHTDHLLLIGANPLESNGSLCTAPDFPGKLKALRARGGTLTVIDPRTTRTAKLADRHVTVRPGTDALLLAAMTYVLFEEKLVDLRELAPNVQDVEELATAVRDFTPEAASEACDVDADTIRALARELAAAPTAAVYGRIGSCTVPHGTLASWLVDVLNILTGNLDRPGGALFPQAATDKTPRPAGPGRGFALGRWHSRVSRHPEAKGELPLAALAEEIDTATPEGSPVRALIAIAANPVLSAPDGDRLDKALDSLDFMVSVDPYLNETARHADVVLPPPPPSQSAHHDFAFNTLAVRNQVRYNRPAVPLEPGRMAETEILARLVLAATGMHGADPSAVDAMVIDSTLGKAVQDPHGPVHERDPKELATRLTGESGPERRLDMMLRLGPYGEGFGARPDGLSLEKLLAHPHGIDLGPLRPRLPQPLKTRSGKIELLPAPIVDDLPRLRAALRERPAAIVLVGRRHLRSNNSWMHNVPALTGGTNRCTLHIHPEDAARLGLADGTAVRVKGAGGEVVAPAEVTDTVRRGVVSLPHGWGHDRPGTRMSHAALDPGVNVNQLLDGSLLDPLSGTAVLNGVPVELAACP
ncbi:MULTISPECIES: molybdopterin oxidoreductase family protein [unclassified Streptomyces]|uniref:molybdopterin oxidoreductase family protein n=1 Tax=unclassified Streptomyces TaxID=2593676 RepID=UPI00116435FF|nr:MULTISPECIES: molybdopterin oxidoreductase family protein [unclassified Streptomyces]NMI57245.1 molybdopterin oxidoreductase family protein [Streptomyces sp. RLA2-12]QDN56611.1 molybdopterin oxidoreductase family protein [Streptomyces sp. S1D4-20]QDN66789.1 molybdopterin oxidoreductase family protein [Streptomyces sp. S1D4-14]QDN97403.1 molybdopterin oxidoreductase family protein [Streptomyces sp. RLB1-9]QDO19109.1 molybdopterin oxidoreductase family protein [Streptomyces sp. S1A1-8]